MNACFIILERWPNPVTRQRSRPVASQRYAETLAMLEREIEALRGYAIELHAATRDVRQDGWPLRDARCDFPGVILRFETAFGLLRFACDEYTRIAANMHAIAGLLAGLRAVQPVGAQFNFERYEGFLPPKPPPKFAPAPAAIEAHVLAAENLLLLGDDEEHTPAQLLANLDLAESVFRRAALRSHPDQGGSGLRFRRATDAIALLRARKVM